MREKKEKKKKGEIKEHPHTNHTRSKSPSEPCFLQPPSRGLCPPARHSPRVDAAEAQPPLSPAALPLSLRVFLCGTVRPAAPVPLRALSPGCRSPPPPRGARPRERAGAAPQRPAPVPARSPRPSEPFFLCSEWTRPRVSLLPFSFFSFFIFISIFNYFSQVHCLPVSVSALPEGGGQGGCLGWRSPGGVERNKEPLGFPAGT